MSSGPTLRASFDMDEISDISLDLIQILDEDSVGPVEAALAFSLSLGRLMAPKQISPEEQIKFTQACMEWAQCYFAEGSVN